MQNIFITAASGNIGHRLIPSLLKNQDTHLVLPTSDAKKLSQYSSHNNVTVIEGPLSDPQWVESQFKTYSIDTIFINLWGFDELFTAFHLLDCVIRSPLVTHVVYLSACGDFLENPNSVIDWSCPHTKIKPPIEHALRRISCSTLREQNFTYRIIGPSLFFENDEKVKEPLLLARKWAEPLGEIGASRVAVMDVAKAIEVALLDRGKKWAGRKINIGSLKMYTGKDIALLWSKALGFSVHAVPSNTDSLDTLEEQIRGKLGSVWGRDLRLLYEGIIKTGFGMPKEEYDLQVEFLGREPAKYEDFVNETSMQWKSFLRNKLPRESLPN